MTQMIHKRSTTLELSVNIFYWFHGANLTLSSDVDQGTEHDLHGRPLAYPCILFFFKLTMYNCRLIIAFSALI